jgi:hypothetical protein
LNLYVVLRSGVKFVEQGVTWFVAAEATARRLDDELAGVYS